MSKKVLYLECSSGISGDMTAAALLDAGADEAAVRRALASLPVDGFEVRISRVLKSGVDACDFDVVLDAAHENHDHDMAYLHGRSHHHDHAHGDDHAHADQLAHGREHDAECLHAHPHDDEHPHEHGDADCPHAHFHMHEGGHAHAHAHGGGHAHEHRGMAEISAIIDAADMTDHAKEIARSVFAVIAEAEAKAHAVSVESVHFHEVGAVDSIADVVAIATALDSLGIDDVVVTELVEGKGTVRCQHGIIPVPVPAVVNIASAHHIPLRILDVQGELVTPTGAAVVAAVRTRDELPPRFVIERVGMGAGKRDYETPGVLRAMIIRAEE